MVKKLVINTSLKKNDVIFVLIKYTAINKLLFMDTYYMKYKSLEEIQQNPVWIKLQSRGTDKKELDKQFLSLSEEEKVVAIDLFESLKVVMEEMLKEKKTHH